MDLLKNAFSSFVLESYTNNIDVNFLISLSQVVLTLTSNEETKQQFRENTEDCKNGYSNSDKHD